MPAEPKPALAPVSIRLSSLLRSLILVSFGVVVSAAPPKLPAQVTVNGAAKSWIVAIPLASEGKQEQWAAIENVAVSTSAHAPSLICAVAVDRATLCQRTPAEGDFAKTFVLDEGRLIEGRFLIGKVPLAGATVSVRPANVEARRAFVMPLLAKPDGELTSTVKTDADGRFRIDHFAPGEYHFEIVTVDGRSEEMDVLTIPPREKATEDKPAPPRLYTVPEFRLADGVSLTVDVRTTDGVAIPRAAVSLAQGGSGDVRRRSFEQKANGEGVVTFHGIDARLPVQIACAAPGFAPFQSTIATPEPLATCVLPRFATITGQVIDAASMHVTDALVELLDDRSKRATTDAHGRFSLNELPAGTYRIRASSLRTGSTTREVSIVEGETTDLGFLKVGELEAAYGRVVDAATGTPVKNAQVRVIDPPGAAAVSDEDGRFILDTDPTTPAVVHVAANGYARAQATLAKTSRESPLSIRMERPGILEVTAWDDDGSSCVGCTVVVAGQDDVRSVMTNESGLARVEGLTPAEYQINRERIAATSRQVVVSGGGDTKVADVRANAITRIELGSASRALRVRVSPFLPADYSVRAVSSARTVVTAKPAADGTQVFQRARGETYDLRVESRNGGVFAGQIAASYTGDSYDARLGSATIEVRLQSKTGDTGGQLLNVVDAYGARAAWARSDGTGITRIPYLQPGNYTVLLGNRPLGNVQAPGVLSATID